MTLGWCVVAAVAAVCLAVVLWLVLRFDPAPADYPSENGDGEDRC